MRVAGYGASPILEIQGPRMLAHDFVSGGKARYHLKDIAAICELAHGAGSDLPAFTAAARQFQRLVDAGGGELGNSAVIAIIEPHPGSATTAEGSAMADLSRFDLTGRLALITGAAQGIGFAVAAGLGRAGASLVLTDIDEPRLERSVVELRQHGLTAESRVLDVRIADQVEAAVAAVEETVGPIEVLVNNAGIQRREALVEMSPESWRQVLDTDLTGVFFVGQAVARRMIKRGHGKIINITSVFSEYSRPTIASYAAAKAGVKNLTKAMCAEWARYGIQANAIGPGYFVTPLTQRLRDDERFDAWLRSRVPAGRWGELDDLVGVAVFLASRASDFVDGQTIHVDGGLLSVI